MQHVCVQWRSGAHGALMREGRWHGAIRPPDGIALAGRALLRTRSGRHAYSRGGPHGGSSAERSTLTQAFLRDGTIADQGVHLKQRTAGRVACRSQGDVT